jgi:predicted dehydrogenase
VCPDVADVSGTLHTFVNERPLVDETVVTSGLGGVAGSERGRVTVDDAAWFMARLEGGAIASVEATRFATGRKNAFRLEVSGSAGAVAFDLERPNELEVLEVDGTESGFRRVLVTEPQHPYVDAWWPAGHGLGWEHAFTHQLRDLVTALAAGTQPTPSFADGLQVQRVLAAVEASDAADSVWLPV